MCPRLSVKVQFREKEFFKIPHGMTANEVERETVKRPAERIGAAVEKPAQRVDSVPGTAACVAVAAAAPALQRLSPLHQTDAKCSVTWSPAFVACCGNVLLSQGVTSRRKLGSDGQRHQISTRDIEKVKTGDVNFRNVLWNSIYQKSSLQQVVNIKLFTKSSTFSLSL